MVKKSIALIIGIPLAAALLMGCVSGPEPVHEPIAGEFQAWADFNRNGTLEQEEMEELTHAIIRMVGEPHEVASPVDEFFDLQPDGHIDEREREIAIHALFEKQFARIHELLPPDEPLPRIVDINGDRLVDDAEREIIFAFLFHEPRLREPRELTDFPLDHIIDRNEDGFVDEEEIRDTALRIGWFVAILPLEPLDELLGREPERMAELAEQGERFPVLNFLDELADLNGDGLLDPEELGIREMALEKPHEVESEFDRRIDFNKDGQIEDFEIRRAVRAEEIVEPEKVEMEAFPVRTPIDELMDLDADGHVDAAEIEIIVSILTNAPIDFRPPQQLYRLFDTNENERIDQQELFMILERFLRPHPVDPDLPLDRELDVNEDGFVGPGEIGVAAGVTEFGEIPSIEELLERMRWMEEIPEEPMERAALEREREADAEEAEREAAEAAEAEWDDAAARAASESEFYRKLGEIQDKKLAVVGLTSTTKTVDKETTDGIVVFVENAFVNVGKVKVVDRQNIEKIMAEHEFQQSDVTDETTAVQIGKLAGANIIVIGSISYVGNRYYLNIKLISVETAEIMGSSIAEAAEASEFLDMTNEAVYKLF